MIFGDSKTKKVHGLMLEYVEVIGHAVAEYRHLIDDYLEWNKEFKKVSKEVRKTESQADDLLRQIERIMLAGALLPAYREDYIGLLESLDKVANKAEDVANTLRLVRPDIPEPIRPVFGQIAALTCEQWADVPDLVKGLIDGRRGLAEAADVLDEKEGQIDKIQRSTTRTIFRDLEVELAQKLLLRQVLDQVCHVSDHIENVGDRIALIAIKHSL